MNEETDIQKKSKRKHKLKAIYKDEGVQRAAASVAVAAIVAITKSVLFTD